MGVSTDGIICYGVDVGEDLPFDLDEHNGEDSWWRHYKSYKCPFEMFTEEGKWIGGKKWPDEKVREYYDHGREWDKANPIPFELVNTCSSDYPMWILAVPGTIVTANRGDPVEINQLTVHTFPHHGEIARFQEFLKEVFDITEEPKWFLCSYWDGE